MSQIHVFIAANRKTRPLSQINPKEIPEFKAPSTYKDPAKIALYVEEARAKWEASMIDNADTCELTDVSLLMCSPLFGSRMLRVPAKIKNDHNEICSSLAHVLAKDIVGLSSDDEVVVHSSPDEVTWQIVRRWFVKSNIMWQAYGERKEKNAKGLAILSKLLTTTKRHTVKLTAEEIDFYNLELSAHNLLMSYVSDVPLERQVRAMVYKQVSEGFINPQVLPHD